MILSSNLASAIPASAPESTVLDSYGQFLLAVATVYHKIRLGLAPPPEDISRLIQHGQELLNGGPSGKSLENLEGPKTEDRMKSGKAEPCGNLPQGDNGKTRDKVAAAVGMSGRTYEEAKAAIEAKRGGQ